jgi:hypothetical protein
MLSSSDSVRKRERRYLHGQRGLANTTITEDGDPPVVHVVGVDARVVGSGDSAIGVGDGRGIESWRHDEGERSREKIREIKSCGRNRS